jgi:hypothetical protein
LVSNAHSSYDVVKKHDDDGELIRGDHKINDAEAAIWRRIFKPSHQAKVHGGSPRCSMPKASPTRKARPEPTPPFVAMRRASSGERAASHLDRWRGLSLEGDRGGLRPFEGLTEGGSTSRAPLRRAPPTQGRRAARAGSSRRRVPDQVGKGSGVDKRFARGRETGGWRASLAPLAADADLEGDDRGRGAVASAKANPKIGVGFGFMTRHQRAFARLDELSRRLLSLVRFAAACMLFRRNADGAWQKTPF